MAPKELRFEPDYGGPDPLWQWGTRSMMPLDRLPVAEATKASIRGWAGRWEKLAWQGMHFHDVQRGVLPGPAEPVPDGAFDEIWREGRVLCDQLRLELGAQWRVGYVSYSDGERRVEWESDAAG